LRKIIHLLFVVLPILALAQNSSSQDSLIRISAQLQFVDEASYPGAVIYSKEGASRVFVEHNGAQLYCDQAVFYEKENFVRALGNVQMIQGDTITMNSDYAEYNGTTELAFASGNVSMRSPESVLQTDTLFFYRKKQQALYRSGGTVKDTASTLTSKKGRFYINEKKYEFLQDVVVNHPEYNINSDHINFYTESGHAYLYGPSTIKGSSSTVYCERGFYDTRNDNGYFIQEAQIDYRNRTMRGDSLYFNRTKNFASATNNIVVIDTLNHSIITGHYAEVYKDKDSVMITKRPVAISTKDADSTYFHADTLLVTGPKENRVLRGFKDVRIYRKDFSARCDSLYSEERTGKSQLIRKPVMWSGKSQITGDSIHIQSDTTSNKLDQLRVFYNAFVVDQDSIQGGFNQIKGRELIGDFKDNELYRVNIYKNVENLVYNYNDRQELIGINKGTSGRMEIFIENQEMVKVRNYESPEDVTYPEAELPENARSLRGLNWRIEEKINGLEELFKGKPEPQLIKIKGLDPPEVSKGFFTPVMSKPNKYSRLKEQDLTNRATTLTSPPVRSKK
jgi:lipopolysaccharide export system protein LptA